MEPWEEQAVITSWIWMGILVFGLFALAIGYLVKRHLKTIKETRNKAAKTIRESKVEYTKRTTHFQELDRKRLSEELHDNVMSRLNVLHLNLFEGNIPSLEKNLRTSMKVVRELSHNLTPIELNGIELSDLFEDYLDQLKHKLDIVYYKDIRSENTLSDGVKRNIFRIFQELISNILKHAEATQLKVQLRCTPKSITMVVADNGKGFTPKRKATGIGLKNISLRVSSLNGHYKYKTVPEQRTQFIMYIPQLN